MFFCCKKSSADALWSVSNSKNVFQSIFLSRDLLNMSSLSWDAGCLIFDVCGFGI